MFSQPNYEIYIPDDVSLEEALNRTTHLGIGAHQDDLEIMATDGILHCFNNPSVFFSGIVMTDGRSSPRSGRYSGMTDDEMISIRSQEQKKAAIVGEYSAQFLLGYSSSQVKSMGNNAPDSDLNFIIKNSQPKIVYTHNLADKHPTHVAVAYRVIKVIQRQDPENKPQKVYGCEVWRNLDWIPDAQKVAFNCSTQINLQEALLGVFDSQISGGKRYDLATMGRRLANATYFESHETDQTTHLAFAMDLTPLIHDHTLDIVKFISNQIDRFKEETIDLLNQITK